MKNNKNTQKNYEIIGIDRFGQYIINTAWERKCAKKPSGSHRRQRHWEPCSSLFLTSINVHTQYEVNSYQTRKFFISISTEFVPEYMTKNFVGQLIDVVLALKACHCLFFHITVHKGLKFRSLPPWSHGFSATHKYTQTQALLSVLWRVFSYQWTSDLGKKEKLNYRLY